MEETKFFSKGINFYFWLTLVFSGFFLSCFLWETKVELKVKEEPFEKDLKINLDTRVEKIFFNLDILPSEIKKKEEKKENDITLSSLVNEKGESLVFKKEDLEELIKFKIKSLIGEEKIFLGREFEKQEIKVEEKDENFLWANIEIKIKGRLIPSYRLEEIKEELIFKKEEEVNEVLNELPDLLEFRISIWPKFLKRLPIFKERIKISIST